MEVLHFLVRRFGVCLVLFLLVSFPVFASDPDLVAYWQLDESSGSVAHDNSGNEYHGTLINMDDSDWVSGKIGNCLEFDGMDDYIETPFILNPADGPFSAFAWVNGGGSNQKIISQNDGDGIGRNWLHIWPEGDGGQV